MVGVRRDRDDRDGLGDWGNTDRCRDGEYHQQKTSPSGRNGSVIVDALCLSHQRHSGVVGKWLPPLQSHAFRWLRDWVRVIAALHHVIDKVEKPSLDGIRHQDSDRPITYQSSSHLFPSSLFCFLVCSQSTISLRLLPPYAPRIQTSIFETSYGSCSAIS